VARLYLERDEVPVIHLGKGGFILGQTVWEEFVPWLRPAATDWLAAHLPAGARVFEWGAGGSTVWLARQGYQVTTIERDGSWYDTVRDELARQLLQDRVLLAHLPALRDYADYIVT